MVRIALAFLVTAFAIASATPSSAERARRQAQPQSYSGTQQQQDACTPDARRLCRKVFGDQNAVLSCLQLNKFKLRRPCRDLLTSHGML